MNVITPLEKVSFFPFLTLILTGCNDETIWGLAGKVLGWSLIILPIAWLI